MPHPVGSWLCFMGTVSLLGSGGLAMSSNENSVFQKSRPLGCDIGIERHMFLQSLQFYRIVRRDLIWETGWVSPQQNLLGSTLVLF